MGCIRATSGSKIVLCGIYFRYLALGNGKYVKYVPSPPATASVVTPHLKAILESKPCKTPTPLHLRGIYIAYGEPPRPNVILEEIE